MNGGGKDVGRSGSANRNDGIACVQSTQEEFKSAYLVASAQWRIEVISFDPQARQYVIERLHG